MADRRLARIVERMQGAKGLRAGKVRLCEVAAAVVDVTGAGVMLMSGDLPVGSLCSTDAVSQAIEDLQYELGEGPCVEAYAMDSPVVESDLILRGPARWPGFAPAAVEAGARAVFGFPLQVGAVRLGALNLYRDQAGSLDDGQHADALVMAGLVARAVLAMQADAVPGELSTELEAGANLQLVVHQASGMASVQLGVSITEALLRIRARAFAQDRPLVAVARDIVSRRLRFDEPL